MSQAGPLDAESSNPQIPTSFITDNGTAIPILNELEVLGLVVANAGVPFESTGVGNVVTYEIQYAGTSAATDATKVGLAAFDSASFNVDANGFVTLPGGGSAATNIDVDASTAPGTDPVVPNGSGNIVITGAQVAAGTVGANVIRSDSLAANSVTIEIQRSTTSATTDSTKNGVCHFDSSDFSVDSNGLVGLSGTGVGQTLTGQSGGALSPTLGNWNVYGATTLAGTTPVSTSGSGSTLTTNVQISQAIASTDVSKIGLAAFDSSAFAVDANGFVTSVGGGTPSVKFGVDSATAPGTNPVLANGSGQVNFTGQVVAAGTSPLIAASVAANTVVYQAQLSQAIAAADSTKVGLSNYDSASFSVSNGFVSLSTTGVGKTITGQSGGSLSPSSNNWNIYGGTVAAGTSPVVTSGSGSTLTTNVQRSQAIASADSTKVGLCNFDSASFAVDSNGFVTYTGTSGGTTWNDVSGAFSPVKSNGYFVTATATGTLPASPSQGDTIKFFVDTTQVLTIQASGTQIIRFGSGVTAAGGTAASSARGDSVELTYRTSDVCWCCIGGPQGTWTLT